MNNQKASVWITIVLSKYIPIKELKIITMTNNILRKLIIINTFKYYLKYSESDISFEEMKCIFLDLKVCDICSCRVRTLYSIHGFRRKRLDICGLCLDYATNN